MSDKNTLDASSETPPEQGAEPKKDNRKKTVMSVGLLIAGALGVGYSYYPTSQPKPAPVSQEEQVMFDAPVEAAVTEAERDIDPTLVNDPSPEEVQAIDPDPISTVSPPSKPLVDKDSIRALDGLKVRYFSHQNTKVQTAKLEEAEAVQAYRSHVMPAPVRVAPPPVEDVDAVARHQYQQMQLKSVILTPNTTRAWVEYQGRLIPVEQGAWIDDLKIHRIEKGSVLLMSKSGRELTLYVPKVVTPTPQPEGDLLNAPRS
ncbi:hypothetical protein [Vibrio chagasii]|uniref:hypothetical protein n=1 Tax=Vibrio chagasii TaxID=170679 RepID=UPI002283CD79|nr:hypothetical protein [Vibrio chagasii]MCY9828830.1 hypothetical protein [Vibrio chagasii]